MNIPQQPLTLEQQRMAIDFANAATIASFNTPSQYEQAQKGIQMEQNQSLAELQQCLSYQETLRAHGY